METQSRREFVRQAAGAASLAFLAAASRAGGAVVQANGEPAAGFLTDVNVHLGPWPFRRISGDEADSLVALLRERGVKRAWTGSMEALLHRDLAAVNARLAGSCRASGAGLLVPFGAINPKLPDWEDDLRRCRDVHRMPGIRLYPNYHGYRLDDSGFGRCAEIAEHAGLILQIVVQLEDRRTQNPLVIAPPVDLSPLAEAARRFPRLVVVVLNSSVTTPLATRLASAGRVFFDISHQEGLQGITRALQSVPVERLLFGSHAPLFMMEANLLKFRESALTDAQLLAIASGNAERLLRPGN